MKELPSITAVCVTFGRVSHLNEMIQCFLAQTCQKKELLIYNTFPRQTLRGDFPNVRIINCRQRPASLGAAREDAISLASGQVIVMCDDDDYILPDHLLAFAQGFAESKADWMRMDRVFYAEGWEIKNTTSTWLNAVAFTKEAWQKAGGYDKRLTVGEDRNFFSRLSEKCRGATIQMRLDKVSAIYCWGNGDVYHVSGMGDDKPGHVPAYERARLDLERRVKVGQEPVGVVDLKPGFAPGHNPAAMVKAYLAKHGEDVKKKQGDCCIVQLGRIGDIINILPIALHVHNHYGTPHMMVSREFAPVLEGVSYVKPYPVDLRNHEILPALTAAGRIFPHVIQAQIWGNGYQPERYTPSYNMESWRVAGFLDKFHDPAWRPWFDLRHLEREELLKAKLFTTDKPKIVLNVTKSISSPFPDGKNLLEQIRERFGKECELINVADLVLPCYVDLLGVLEAASVLVSIDTSLLHLAAATDVPVVALTNPRAWLGTKTRCRTVSSLNYDIAKNKPELVLAGIERAIGMRPLPVRVQSLQGLRQKPAQCRAILHAVERHPDTSPKEAKRKAAARASWQVLYKEHGVLPCHLWDHEYPRNAMDIGDPRPLAFLKDVVQKALNQAGSDDIIMLTNDDIYLHPELPELLRYHVPLFGACCSQRCEMVGGMLRQDAKPSEWAAAGRLHMGRDLFAFTPHWLRTHWNEIGDFVLGCSDWDLALAALLRVEKSLPFNRQSAEWNLFPCELERGYVAHEAHSAKWNDPNYVNTAPGQIHNRRLFREWAKKHLPSLTFSPVNTI